MDRRTFFKVVASAVGGASVVGFDLNRARAEMRELKISRTTETRSICPYCAVSCGVIIHTLGDKPKNVIVHGNRLTTPQVRRPGSDHWEDISWDDAIAGIARHVKTTRDRTFVAKNAKGETVNRTPG